jgi:RimJ/RimL family protein N-acetyltransferase
MSGADASEQYLSWMQDHSIIQYLESRFTVPDCTKDLADFIDNINNSADSLLFGIFLLEDGRHIGNIKLGPIVFKHLRSELGYLIGDSDCWGQGYASEAIYAVCQFAFRELGLAKVGAGVYEVNKGSSKALLKAGFTHIATIPSDIIFENRRIASLLYGITISDC